MNPIFLICCLFTFLCGISTAQIAVELNPVKKAYVCGEAIMMDVSISNYSGQSISFKNHQNIPWLDISINRTDNDEHLPQARFANFPEVTIPAGKKISRRVDMRYLYDLSRPGYYNAQAYVKTQNGKDMFSSKRMLFMVQDGTSVAKRTVNGVTGSRCQYNVCSLTENQKLQLYVQVRDPESETIKNAVVLGEWLSFSKPVLATDKDQNLHILFMSTPSHYIYSCVNMEGKKTSAAAYRRIEGIQPRLVNNANGTVSVTDAVYVDPKAKPVKMRDATEIPQ